MEAQLSHHVRLVRLGSPRADEESRRYFRVSMAFRRQLKDLLFTHGKRVIKVQRSLFCLVEISLDCPGVVAAF